MFCKLFYILDDKKIEWPIEASANRDTYETLKRHVAEYVPKAKFLGFQIGETFREETDDE